MTKNGFEYILEDVHKLIWSPWLPNTGVFARESPFFSSADVVGVRGPILWNFYKPKVWVDNGIGKSLGVDMKIEMPPSAYCATSYSKNIGGTLSMINQKKISIQFFSMIACL
jgi:hypothetical protein